MSVVPPESTAQPPDPIKHVIVLMFENRSFDQMLGDFQTKYPELDGVDRSNRRSNPEEPKSRKRFKQRPSTARIIQPGPFHETRNILTQINRRPGLEQCEGFVFDYTLSNHVVTPEQQQEVMNFYERGTLPALHALAEDYLICDSWHASVVGPTWTNRFFMHTGTSIGIVKMPTGLSLPWSTYTQPTVYDRLDERNVSWRIYYGDFPQSLLLVNQHRPENLKNYYLHDDFFNDLRRADTFPAYSFIEPRYFPLTGQNDYHPPSDILNGEAFLGKVYNAIRQSPIWSFTLFVVVFDEHGGFYDHKYPPATATPPDAHDEEHPFTQYGVRVPALLISPYTKAGVTHELYDHTSILKYLTEKFSLGPLGKRVPSATSIGRELLTSARPDGDLPDHVRMRGPNPKIKDIVGDPKMLELDAGQTAAVNFTVHLEGASMTPAEVRMMRNAMVRQGPEGQVTVAIDRVRDYLDKTRG